MEGSEPMAAATAKATVELEARLSCPKQTFLFLLYNLLVMPILLNPAQPALVHF